MSNLIRHAKTPFAFTLIELLVVISIFSLLLAVTTPSFLSIMKGSSLGQSGQLVVDQLLLARQEAIISNRAVEFRFYQYSDPADSTGGAAIRGVQFFRVESDGTLVPKGRMTKLLKGTLVTSDTTLSGMAAQTFQTPTATDPILPGINGSYTYLSLHFLSDGTTDLPLGNSNFLTIISATDVQQGSPKNYYCIAIEPHTGHIRIYRP